MPRYDYRCRACQRTFTLTYATVTEVDQVTPTCPRCGSTDLSRLITRVSILTNEETRLERLADPDRLGGLDENDPRALGRMMREMSHEMGEDLGPEFGEVVGRLEAGESPESIEQSLPDLGGDDLSTPD
jgi:putative FmdB family regulatory protein